MALATEQWLHPHAHALRSSVPAGTGKALLVRDVAEPSVPGSTFPCVESPRPSTGDSTRKNGSRSRPDSGSPPKKPFDGFANCGRAPSTPASISTSLGTSSKWSERSHDSGCRCPTGPGRGCKRSTSSRTGVGSGTATPAVRGDRAAQRRGCRAVVVGADEDDWPLHWYRRRGFSGCGARPAHPLSQPFPCATSTASIRLRVPVLAIAADR